MRRAADRNWILDERTMVATLVVNAHLGNYAPALGSAQMLPNGTLDFDSGFAEQTIEVLPNGRKTYMLKMTMPGKQYRSYIYASLYGDTRRQLLALDADPPPPRLAWRDAAAASGTPPAPSGPHAGATSGPHARSTTAEPDDRPQSYSGLRPAQPPPPAADDSESQSHTCSMIGDNGTRRNPELDGHSATGFVVRREAASRAVHAGILAAQVPSRRHHIRIEDADDVIVLQGRDFQLLFASGIRERDVIRSWRICAGRDITLTAIEGDRVRSSFVAERGDPGQNCSNNRFPKAEFRPCVRAHFREHELGSSWLANPVEFPAPGTGEAGHRPGRRLRAPSA